MSTSEATHDGPFSVVIQAADFDVGVELARLRAWPEVARGAGAVASFVGTVRDEEGAVQSLTLEHYPGMTERAIAGMIDAARERFPLFGVRVVHRVGPLSPGSQIVLVATASKSRRAAFESCEFLMDYLKTQAPFWKKERGPDGLERWVDARVEDDDALARWGLASDNAGSTVPSR